VQGDDDEKEDEQDKDSAGALMTMATGRSTPSSPATRRDGTDNWLAAAAPAHGIRTGAQITLKQGEDILGHGFMLDSEPDVQNLFDDEHHPVPEPARIPAHWPIVKITSVGRGAGRTQISEDSVFSEVGDPFDEPTERSLDNLCLLDQVIIWHDFVFPRQQRVKAARSRSKKKVQRR
jgi:hypothetical protein